MYSDHVIYGKDETQNIVALEVKDELVYAFFNDGTCLTQPLQAFILSSTRLNEHFSPLEGSNYFSYISVYNNEKSFKMAKKSLRNYKNTVWMAKDLAENHMVYKGTSLFKGLKLEEVGRLGFDIESDGLVQHEKSTIYTIANTYRKGSETIKKVFVVDDYDNAGDMLVDWCAWVTAIDPTMLVGHNIIGYDLPYMQHVARLNGVELELGRDSSPIKFEGYSRNYRVDGSQTWEYNNPRVFGRHVIDTMFLAVKYDVGRSFPSWGLKPIIEHLGLVKDGRQFYDASKIHENWDNPEEKARIIEYCQDDGDDALNLFEIMAPSFFYMNQSIPKSFQMIVNGASGSWINYILIRAYLQQGKSIPKASEPEKVYGGISFGVAGIHDNVFKIDIKSMYPSIMRAFNIYDPVKDPDAIFSKMVETFTIKRFDEKSKHKETGDKYWYDMQGSSKIFINSCYGALGCAGLHFNNYYLADKVTGIARNIIKKTMLWATGKSIKYWWKDYETNKDQQYLTAVNYKPCKFHDFEIVNADTDSISFRKKDSSIFIEEEQNGLIEEINNILPDLIEYEEDGYFDRVVVIKAKNYVMKEGNKIKYKGSSIRDSKKEIALREMLNRVIEDSLIHEKEDLSNIYCDYIKEVCDIEDITRWSVKKSVTENLLSSERKNETKVVDALQGTEYRIGDKVKLFSKIDGMVPMMVKGEPKRLKSGELKMIPNRILCLENKFDGDYDVKHYLDRTYKTMKILETVIDMNKIKNYSLKKNITELQKKGLLTNIKCV